MKECQKMIFQKYLQSHIPLLLLLRLRLYITRSTVLCIHLGHNKNVDTPPSKNESSSTSKGKSIVFLSKNVHSLRNESQRLYLDVIVELMSFRKIDVYLIQETWLDGDYVSEIKGYTLFHHGLKNKSAVEVNVVQALFYLQTFCSFTKILARNLR